MTLEQGGSEPVAVPTSAYLDALSRLTARSFESLDDAMTTIVEFVADQVGTRSSFLTHITPGEEKSEVLAAFNAVGGCDVTPGAILSLPQTF